MNDFNSVLLCNDSEFLFVFKIGKQYKLWGLIFNIVNYFLFALKLKHIIICFKTKYKQENNYIAD